MTWIDIDFDNVKMKCDWCEKKTWWIHDGEGIADKKLEGWAHIDIIGELDIFKHICPDCYRKRLEFKED